MHVGYFHTFCCVLLPEFHFFLCATKHRQLVSSGSSYQIIVEREEERKLYIRIRSMNLFGNDSVWNDNHLSHVCLCRFLVVCLSLSFILRNYSEWNRFRIDS